MPSEIEYPQNICEELKQSIASLKLEGISLSPETISDIQLIYERKLTEEQGLERLFNRLGIDRQVLKDYYEKYPRKPSKLPNSN